MLKKKREKDNKKENNVEKDQATEQQVAEQQVVEQQVVEQVKEVNVDFKEKFMRTNADFQNYKRRIEKERLIWMETAQGSVLNKILPIIDDLDRAIKTGEENVEDEAEQAWLDGFKIIQKNSQKTLKELGVEEIDCSGEFDPELHEALVQVESDKHKEGEVVQVLNKGYKFKDAILRHAKVSVAK
jgi:molecular chaperone GrpE